MYFIILLYERFLKKAKLSAQLNGSAFVVARITRGESDSPRFYHFCIRQFTLSFSASFSLICFLFNGIPNAGCHARNK